MDKKADDPSIGPSSIPAYPVIWANVSFMSWLKMSPAEFLMFPANQQHSPQKSAFNRLMIHVEDM